MPPGLRHWNIALAASLLASSACGSPVPDDSSGDEIGEDSGGETEATDSEDSEASETEESTPECTTNADCGPNEICDDGECVDDPGGDTGGYPRQPEDECEDSADCPRGTACFSEQWSAENWITVCYAVREFTDCEGPTMVAVSLPPEAGDAVDLQFADVDGDELDELVVLTEQALEVFDEGQLSATTALPANENTELELMHVDEDGELDAVMTSDQAGQSFVALGLGGGSFAAPIPGPGDALADSHSLDWIPGGPEELVGRAGELVNIYPDLLTPMADYEQLSTEASRLTAVADDDEPRIAIVDWNDVEIYSPGQNTSFWTPDYLGFGDRPNLAYGRFYGNANVSLVMIDAYPGRTLVTAVGQTWDAGIEASEALTFDPFASGRSSALLFDPGPPTLLFHDPVEDEAIGCRATLDALPPTATRARAGDIDGDGFAELAIIDANGGLSLWSASPD